MKSLIACGSSVGVHIFGQAEGLDDRTALGGWASLYSISTGTPVTNVTWSPHEGTVLAVGRHKCTEDDEYGYLSLLDITKDTMPTFQLTNMDAIAGTGPVWSLAWDYKGSCLVVAVISGFKFYKLCTAENGHSSLELLVNIPYDRYDEAATVYIKANPTSSYFACCARNSGIILMFGKSIHGGVWSIERELDTGYGDLLGISFSLRGNSVATIGGGDVAMTWLFERAFDDLIGPKMSIWSALSKFHTKKPPYGKSYAQALDYGSLLVATGGSHNTLVLLQEFEYLDNAKVTKREEFMEELRVVAEYRNNVILGNLANTWGGVNCIRLNPVLVSSVSMEKAIWDAHYLRFFCDICMDEVNANNRDGGCLSRKGYKNLEDKFAEKTGKRLTKKQFKNKWDSLKKEYTGWMELLNATGLGWDPETKTMDADNDWWQTHLQYRPEHVKFRYGPPANLTQLDVMFNKAHVTGESSAIPGEEETGADKEAAIPVDDDDDASKKTPNFVKRLKFGGGEKEKESPFYRDYKTALTSLVSFGRGDAGGSSGMGDSVPTMKEFLCMVRECGIKEGTDLMFTASKLAVKREHRELLAAFETSEGRLDYLQRMHNEMNK